MSSKIWSDGQKVDFKAHLLILADKALELEQWRIAQELQEIANSLSRNRERWTAAGVAITMGFDEPRTLTGRDSGRTTRMLCQAVSDAANGMHVGIVERPDILGITSAEKMLERLRSHAPVSLTGAIHRAGDSKIRESMISAVYIDHHLGWRTRPERGY